MGCCYSRIEREETVSRCKARKSYMKQLVKARQSLCATHSLYLRSLRSTGSALLQFTNVETNLHLHHRRRRSGGGGQVGIPSPSPKTPLPPPPPPMSPSSSTTWTSVSTSSVLPPPPSPPPPPPAASTTWDFWDPFMPAASRSVTEEEWEAATSAAASEVMVTKTGAVSSASASIAPPSMVSGFSKNTSSTELAVVVSRNAKDLVEIIKELDEYFLKAAESGAHLSSLLEVPNSNFSSQNRGARQVYNYGLGLNPSNCSWGGSSPKSNVFVSSNVSNSHCSTVERLYAWEKKLYQEVKGAETIKIEHEKRVTQFRKLEMKGDDYLKTEKMKKEVEKLESQMMVAVQAIESTSSEIIKLREIDLYPQLLDLLKGLMCMWRAMYECHQVQTHIVEQLKYLNTIPSTMPTSEIHRQSALQLELEVQQWHLSFCNLVKSQQDYIQSLAGWLRLSLFQFTRNPLAKTGQDSRIYSLCEDWHQAVDRIPDKVASEGIKSFLAAIHAIVVQQAEEHRQKKRAESAFKELDKRATELRSLQCKHGPYSLGPEISGAIRRKDPIMEKRVKVEMLRAKAQEEKVKHEKTVSVTRAMTMNNLQMGFPNVFQAMVGFSSVCMQAYESVFNQAKISYDEVDVKRLMP